MRLLLLAVLLALSACSDQSAPPARPASFADVHKNIAKVESTDAELTSVHLIDRGYHDDIALFAMATDVKNIVETARKNNLMPQSRQIRFVVFAPFSDRYGNRSLEPMLGLVFDTSELLKINFASKAFTEFHLVDLYAHVWRRDDLRYSQNAIQAYCGKYRAHTRYFCGRESF